jgi:hypothetical protein
MTPVPRLAGLFHGFATAALQALRRDSEFGCQFMQRGCVRTLAASAKIARERSAGSANTIDLLQTFAAQSVVAIQKRKFVRESGGEKPAAPTGERAQVAVRREYEPRAAHACVYRKPHPF